MFWDAALPLLLWIAISSAQDPIRPYPLPDGGIPTTSILDHSSYVQDLDDPQWYLDNIPFVDFPDQSLNDVYYYRASVIKRHLKYAHEGHGWVFTEFIHPVAWASKFQTIPDSAAHQILEARWLRDPNYSKDVINLYTRAGVEAVSGITYTHYIHDAIYEHAQATGDTAFLASQLDGLIKTYELWNGTVDRATGLYHRTPLQDAQEYSLPGYLTGGPGAGPVQMWNDPANDYDTVWLGPETYRPNFNAYMVAGARAIAAVATLAGNDDLASQWDGVAEALYARMRERLYDSELNFWIDVVAGTDLACRGRELIGYFPYRFGVGVEPEIERGLLAGLTPEAFLTEFGPTTLEQTNPYFTALKNTTYCCIWQGQSWPFSTSVYLGTLARLARQDNNNNSSSSSSSNSSVVQLFHSALTAYTHTNYKDSRPYTAESHYPALDRWSGDTTNHSEHYLHSTYLDNVLTNLVGVIPTLEARRLELRPLVPGNWSWFAVENLPYHGTLVSVVWDETGTHYANKSNGNSTAGLSVYANGQMIYNQPTLAPVNVTLSSAAPLSNSTTTTNNTNSSSSSLSSTRYVNILSNPNSPHGLPSITADYTLTPNGDGYPAYAAWKLNDGLLWYDTPFPDNYWTNNQSTTPVNMLTITLPRPRTFSSISLAVLADVGRGGVIDCPAAVTVMDASMGKNGTGTVLAKRDPWDTCRGNALNTIAFDAGSVTTGKIAVQLANRIRYAVALSEVQIWVPATGSPSSSSNSSNSTSSSTKSFKRQNQAQEGVMYYAADSLPGTFIGGFEGRASGMNDTLISLPDGSSAMQINRNGWIEWGGVYSSLGADGMQPGPGSLSVLAAGNSSGSVDVQVNFLSNTTVSLGGGGRVAVGDVQWLVGGNVVTVWWRSGAPVVEGIVVGG